MGISIACSVRILDEIDCIDTFQKVVHVEVKHKKEESKKCVHQAFTSNQYSTMSGSLQDGYSRREEDKEGN